MSLKNDQFLNKVETDEDEVELNFEFEDEEDHINVILNAPHPTLDKIEGEIEHLIQANTIPSTDSLITLRYNNSFIKVHSNQPLSYELQGRLWGREAKGILNLPNAHLLEQTIASLSSENEIVGFLGVYYIKNGPDKAFTELALIVCQGKTILGCAIFNQYGNVGDLLREHNPNKIYYKLDDDRHQFLTFLNYKYTPFYALFRDRNLIPMRPGKWYQMYNVQPFCPTINPFCSLCSSIKLMLSIYQKDFRTYTKSKTGLLKRERVRRIVGKPLTSQPVEDAAAHQAAESITVGVQPIFARPILIKQNTDLSNLERLVRPPRYYYSTKRIGNALHEDELRLRLSARLSCIVNTSLRKASVQHLSYEEQNDFYKINRWLQRPLSKYIYKKIIVLYVFHSDEFKSLVTSIV